VRETPGEFFAALARPITVPARAATSGSELVARSTPDGYTFLVSANAALAINPALQKNLSFDVDRNLATVARGVMTVNVLVVAASDTPDEFAVSLKAKRASWAEFIQRNGITADQ